MSLFWPVLVLLSLALLAPALSRLLRGITGWALGAAFATLFLFFLRLLPLPEDGAHQVVLPWVRSLGLELAFRVDGLAATFALLITGIGALVVVYAGEYLRGDPRLGRFYAFLLLFAAAMLGLVLSDNLIGLFVFWELTSISSYLLIGFDHENEDSRRSALQALLVTGAGGIVLMAGFLLLYLVGMDRGLTSPEAWRISSLMAVDVRGHHLYLTVLPLVLFGAFTKSAQVPFHFWLPSAMAAPTPVSSYLHSATMVKAGIFLLARLHPLLGQTLPWQVLVSSAGALTMVMAALLALGQHDLKRILAYSTVSVLGILTLLVGLGTEPAIKAMVVLMVAHALYKAALFMIAGNVDHEAGTRNVDELGGLRRVMPLSATAGLIAALSKAGAPPLFGFVGKELLYKAKIQLDTLPGILLLSAVLANVVLVATSLMAGVRPFFGRPRSIVEKAHEAPPSMVFGPMLLGAGGLFIGLLPSWFDAHLGSPMASAIAGESLAMKLQLWHGLNPEALAVLGLSAVTLALGVWLFFRLRKKLEHTAAIVSRWGRFGPTAAFDPLLAGLYSGAGRLTRAVQNGSLRRYMLILIVFAASAILVPVLAAFRAEVFPAIGELRPWELLVALMIVAGAGLSAFTSSRLTAVAGLGAVGTGIALIFLFFGAPDLAITQIMVETLTVILFVLVFHRMRPFEQRSSRAGRLRDLALALAAGTSVTFAVLAAIPVRSEAPLARWFADMSVPLAHGRNVVNVILVDFRALDTLGEITVLAVAGLGVYGLLRLGVGGKSGAGADRR